MLPRHEPKSLLFTKCLGEFIRKMLKNQSVPEIFVECLGYGNTFLFVFDLSKLF